MRLSLQGNQADADPSCGTTDRTRRQTDTTMTILNHPEWPTLRWCLFLEYVGRDPRPGRTPRHRIEVRRNIPDDLAAYLVTLRSPCVACGTTMAPIRKRKRGRLYFAASCEDALHGRCSKGQAARQEYTRIREALLALAGLAVPAPMQDAPRLPFDELRPGP